MNKVLGFVKGNLVVVISVVLILAFLPTGYIFAGKWNTKVYEKAKAAYDKEKRNLDSRGSVTYGMIAVLEGEQDLTESRAPNNAVTEFYVQNNEEREAQVLDVVARGTAFNQGDHVELVPGILPKASDDRTMVRLAREMAEAIVGTPSTPSVYQRKLQRLNAGSPPDPEGLAATLVQVKEDQQKRYEGSNADGKLTPDQTKQLEKDIVSRRLGEYIGRSNSLTFYCSPDSFITSRRSPQSTGRAGRSQGGADRTEYSDVPGDMPTSVSAIDETQVFNWLWDFWVISDVLDAVGAANTSAQTGSMAIPNAPVKSVELIRVSKLETADAPVSDDQQSSGRSGRSGRGQTGAVSTQVDDAQPSHTGRKSGQPGSAFDLRTVELVAVVSSQDLPRLIDAIGKSNYMTVTDVDLAEVDVWSDLEGGYYYGDSHVMRASITIETVWLRSWMAPLMPDAVKLALGIPVNNNEEIDG
jgi:hypothetical protein